MIPIQGSKIRIDFERGYQKITIPQKPGGIMKYLLACFLIFWLGGWAMGWKSAFFDIAKGDSQRDAFLIFWLAGWTVGGIFALFFLYRIVQRPIPEILILSRPNIIHDSGVAPFNPGFSIKSQTDFWKNFIAKRVKQEFIPEEIRTIKLREHENGNRLTLDKGTKRIELAKGASEPEKEWLFDFINKEYSS